MSYRVAFAFALACLLSAAQAPAALINFETTPAGATPLDNAKLTSPYSVSAGATTVTFGIDTNNNLTIELNAIFEARPGVAVQDDSGPRQSYTTNIPGNPGQPDEDLTGTGVGGNWLLRNPKTAEEGGATDFKDPGRALLILYGGVLPNSASGEIWDIDAFATRIERWQVDAYNSSGQLIATQLSPFGLSEDNDPNTLNGKPWTFSFDNLPAPIAAIRIHYIGITLDPVNDGTVGFGFDNFDALNPAAVPEPASLTLFGLGAVGLVGYCWRQRRRSGSACS